MQTDMLSDKFRIEAECDLNEGLAQGISPLREYLTTVSALRSIDDERHQAGPQEPSSRESRAPEVAWPTEPDSTTETSVELPMPPAPTLDFPTVVSCL